MNTHTSFSVPNPSMHSRHWNTNRGMICTANGSFLDGNCTENCSLCACFMSINVFVIQNGGVSYHCQWCVCLLHTNGGVSYHCQW
jgi:hypothetical protein